MDNQPIFIYFHLHILLVYERSLFTCPSPLSIIIGCIKVASKQVDEGGWYLKEYWAYTNQFRRGLHLFWMFKETLMIVFIICKLSCMLRCLSWLEESHAIFYYAVFGLVKVYHACTWTGFIMYVTLYLGICLSCLFTSCILCNVFIIYVQVVYKHSGAL